MEKILVINSKGGCGKTTVATNLASFYAAKGHATALYDYDPQGSAARWLDIRDKHAPPIHGVNAAHADQAGVTRSFLMRIPPETEKVIIDTPASLKRMEHLELLRGVTTILIPLMPSVIDIFVARGFVQDLLKMARTAAPDAPIGVIANRVRQNTHAYRNLRKVLDDLQLPLVTWLRDTQHYLHAIEQGIGVHELQSRRAQVDREHWDTILDWVESSSEDKVTAQMHKSFDNIVTKPVQI